MLHNPPILSYQNGQDQNSMQKNKEYILQIENLSKKPKPEHQKSIEDTKRQTFFGNIDHGFQQNPVMGMSHEGFMTDKFKSRRSLVRSSSTNFNARFSYHPDYHAASNLPSGRDILLLQKRGKTSQHTRSRRPRASKTSANNKINRKAVNYKNWEGGSKVNFRPKSENHN